MGRAFGETDRVAKLIPVGPGISIESALTRVPELRSLYESDASVRELIDTARKVEGISRHASTHAAGVVISRDPLVEHVPLQRAGGKSEGSITTQFPMGQLEDLGLLKMDFLGLRTLTVLGKAINLLRQDGHDISLETLPLDDPAAYEGLRRGETTGVFQLEGATTTRMTVDVAPNRFQDLVALMALIRPGPMEMAPDYISRKHGRTPIEYMHPEMEPILRETYGVALYQEQVMRIANVLAGFTMAEGDGLRKAMGKKLPEEMAKYRDRFVAGCAERGVEKRLAGEIFAMIERFAGYGFNKAHSAAYAVIGAQTAYLKAHYPVEFMAALLSSELGNTDRIVALLAECRRAAIAVFPPCVSRSEVEFSVERTSDGGQAVRFGLAAVKNVGTAAAAAMVSCRKVAETGEFKTLSAFCDAIDWSSINRRAVESLVKAGALDSLGGRASVLAALDSAVAAAQKRQRASARGQMDLFGGESAVSTPAVPTPVVEIASRQVLEWERELLGTYMSDHPLSEVLRTAMRTSEHTTLSEIAQLAGKNVGATVRVLALVAAIRRIVTSSNRSMAVATIEDLSGQIDAVLFPDTFDRHGSLLSEGAILDVRGRIDRRGETLQIVCDSLSDSLPEASVSEAGTEALVLRFAAADDPWADIRTMQQVDEILRRYEGDTPIVVEVPAGRAGLRRFRSRSRRVDWSQGLQDELRKIAGLLAAHLVPAGEIRLAS
jgi:DNA polymerase-3 subunit alpha